MEVKEIIAALTNGVNEKPYCKRVDEEMKVFVADEQEYCTIALIDEYDETIAQAICEAGMALIKLQADNEQLQQWIYELQSGLYINCVYCGFNYGPKESTAPTMQQALYDHIKVCEKHPLSKALVEIERLKIIIKHWEDIACEYYQRIEMLKEHG